MQTTAEPGKCLCSRTIVICIYRFDGHVVQKVSPAWFVAWRPLEPPVNHCRVSTPSFITLLTICLKTNVLEQTDGFSYDSTVN